MQVPRIHQAGIVVCTVLLAVSDARSQPRADQQPSFRSGVEVVAVEVGVVDGQGRPVRGLEPSDFTVTVEGQPRRVVTAEFMEASDAPAHAARPEVVPVSTNERGSFGRLVVFVLDINTLEIGDARQIAAAASRLLAQLTLADRSALVSLPVGENVAFTWAHDRVREALLRAGSGGGVATTWEYGSLAEARDIATRGSFALREVAMRECSSAGGGGGFGGGFGEGAPAGGSQPAPPAGGGSSGGSSGSGGGSGGTSGTQAPSTSAGQAFSNDRCTRWLQAQAEVAWSMARANSLSSLAALRQLLLKLRSVQGDKAVVLISGGWPLDEGDEISMLRPLVADAAAARATLFTVFVPRPTGSASRRMSRGTLAEESMHHWPLENLASMTGGRTYRGDASPEGIFDRLSRELSGYYRVGVEKHPGDDAAGARRMKVQVGRNGLTVRARAIFDAKTYEDRDWAARLGAALDSPVPATALGLRVTSYLGADPEDPRLLRLVLAGDATRLQPGEATMRLLVRDLEGKGVTGGDQRLTEPHAGETSFAVNVRIPPGSYLVRLAVQDGAGRVGSVDHRVEARPVALGAVSVMGPTLLRVAASGSEPQFALDTVRPDDRLAVEVGLQGDRQGLKDADVMVEILASPDGPALLQQSASLSPGSRDGSMFAHAVADMRLLPPGQYLARVRVDSGSERLGHVERAFSIGVSSAAPAPAGAADAALEAAAAPPAMTPLRVRAAGAAPRFAMDAVLGPQVLGGFLDRVAARPDAASPIAGELLDRARAEGLNALTVSDEQSGQTPIASFLKGLTLLSRNQLNPAATAFRAAMRASPDFYPAMVYLGACYAAAGNDKEAAAIWRTALIREGHAPALHVLLADALLRQGSGEMALQVITAARARWPEDTELKRRFVLASLAGGDPGAGLLALDELVRSGADDERSLVVALLVLYDSLVNGREIHGRDQDYDRMMQLADAYRARGGPSLPLVDTWVKAITAKKDEARR